MIYNSSGKTFKEHRKIETFMVNYFKEIEIEVKSHKTLDEQRQDFSAFVARVKVMKAIAKGKPL